MLDEFKKDSRSIYIKLPAKADFSPSALEEALEGKKPSLYNDDNVYVDETFQYGEVIQNFDITGKSAPEMQIPLPRCPWQER